MKFNQVKTALGPKIRQNEFAQAADVVARTVYNWRKRTRPEDFPKLGRPAHDERAHASAFWKVGREYLRQGRCGWRPIKAALGRQVPTRLIHEHLRRFKAREARHERRRILRNRVRLEVLAKNALWVQDSVQVARDESGAKIETLAVKDRGPLVTVGLSTGQPARGRDVVELLECLKRTRGLPWVIGSDNGAPFVCEEVREYLGREKVIHLRSLPRTPQHNGSAEVGIGEMSATVGVIKAERTSYEQIHARMVKAAVLLNKNRIRMSKGLKSGAELDDKYQDTSKLGERDRFYADCSKCIEAATLRASSAREKRMAEREAIYSTMEKYGLVRRHRGGSQATTKAEIFL